jgi:hypothetical protein
VARTAGQVVVATWIVREVRVVASNWIEGGDSLKEAIVRKGNDLVAFWNEISRPGQGI